MTHPIAEHRGLSDIQARRSNRSEGIAVEPTAGGALPFIGLMGHMVGPLMDNMATHTNMHGRAPDGQHGQWPMDNIANHVLSVHPTVYTDIPTTGTPQPHIAPSPAHLYTLPCLAFTGPRDHAPVGAAMHLLVQASHFVVTFLQTRKCVRSWASPRSWGTWTANMKQSENDLKCPQHVSPWDGGWPGGTTHLGWS